jgi:hypothetical protein
MDARDARATPIRAALKELDLDRGFLGQNILSGHQCVRRSRQP